MDSEIDEIKAKKIQEYKEAYQEAYQEAVQKEQMDVFKKSVILKYMTKEARERLNRIRLVKPEIAEKIEIAIIQAIQQGQIKEILTEQQLMNILNELTEKKGFRILKR